MRTPASPVLVVTFSPRPRVMLTALSPYRSWGRRWCLRSLPSKFLEPSSHVRASTVVKVAGSYCWGLDRPEGGRLPSLPCGDRPTHPATNDKGDSRQCCKARFESFRAAFSLGQFDKVGSLTTLSRSTDIYRVCGLAPCLAARGVPNRIGRRRLATKSVQCSLSPWLGQICPPAVHQTMRFMDIFSRCPR